MSDFTPGASAILPRLYYSYPITASFAHSRFGILFEDENDFAGIKRLSAMYADDKFYEEYCLLRPDGFAFSKKLYIHSQSYAVFVPQTGDLLSDGNGAIWIAQRDGGNAKILKRSGLPFAWPECEVVDAVA